MPQVAQRGSNGSTVATAATAARDRRGSGGPETDSMRSSGGEATGTVKRTRCVEAIYYPTAGTRSGNGGRFSFARTSSSVSQPPSTPIR
jgi:hypothetical protein